MPAFSSKSLALAAAATTMNGAALVSAFSSPDTACQFFSSNYGNLTNMPNTTTYTDINTDYWSAAAALGPACIFSPSSAELMSVAVKKLVDYNTPFAIKGGGHLAIAGSNNINSTGVTLTGDNLSQIVISDDKKSVDVGPGNKWGTVMNYLQDFNLSVVGGRMSIVGVPGLLTGGGMSNFGNEYGWASSNINSYTCVLADGTIAEVTADNKYKDLFWALRGGGNSFCLVTNFNLKLLEVPAFNAGEKTWSVDQADGFLDAVYYMAVNPDPDVKGAISPVANWGSGMNKSFMGQMFYNGDDSAPAFFANFSAPALPPVTDDFGPVAGMGAAATRMAEGTDQIEGFRNGWWFLTIKADRHAMQLVYDTYMAFCETYFADVEIWITGLAMNMISKNYVTAGIENGGEDPMGLDPADAPFIMFEESLTWYYATDDDTIQKFYTDFNANITAQLEPLGVLTDFVYLNDANGDQDVFAGYPLDNVKRLQTIREKYDPNRVYTDLMPGGWKVADWEETK